MFETRRKKQQIFHALVLEILLILWQRIRHKAMSQDGSIMVQHLRVFFSERISKYYFDDKIIFIDIDIIIFKHGFQRKIIFFLHIYIYSRRQRISYTKLNSCYIYLQKNFDFDFFSVFKIKIFQSIYFATVFTNLPTPQYCCNSRTF